MLHIMIKVKFSLPSDSELVGDFNYVSLSRTVEHCWLFISRPSHSVFLAYTHNNQSGLDVMSLGSVADFHASRLKMLKEAIFVAYRLSNSKF